MEPLEKASITFRQVERLQLVGSSGFLLEHQARVAQHGVDARACRGGAAELLLGDVEHGGLIS